ncbi:MAG: TetR/AcrR family transcriptional regulator [Gemmatimonadaceae bacterium]
MRPTSGPGRQELRSTGTRSKLVHVGRALFAARGFDAVPAEEIVERAGLTRGALYHHFGGKVGLFEAVHETLHGEIAERITRACETAEGPWRELVAGCLAFLDACTDPEAQRIVLLDGPAVLGWERWREVDAAYSLGLLKEGLREVMAAGEIAEQPVDPLAHLLSGAMNEAGMWIARAAKPKSARREAGAALRAMLEALRTSR